eukprot:2285835-Amphidinium_carterae.1
MLKQDELNEHSLPGSGLQSETSLRLCYLHCVAAVACSPAIGLRDASAALLPAASLICLPQLRRSYQQNLESLQFGIGLRCWR